MNHPMLIALLTGTGLWVGKLWCDDLRAAQTGRPNPNSLPGATAAPLQASIIAVLGALVLVTVETGGEIALGVAGEQSRMTWCFAFYSICAAPVIEELVFRGWIIVETRGRALQWGAAAGASVAFAALHPFLWQWDADGFTLKLGLKGGFSTAVVFVTSLWLYAARLAPWNPQRSLLPCFAGHAAKNLGVVAIKAATGFMGGLW